ncbi:hypothetical protein GQX74_008478 [Glossina fuscipes]|nr:hypothetical protein GQX74_008478 [Glossina fuscipes]
MKTIFIIRSKGVSTVPMMGSLSESVTVSIIASVLSILNSSSLFFLFLSGGCSAGDSVGDVNGNDLANFGKVSLIEGSSEKGLLPEVSINEVVPCGAGNVAQQN